MKHIQEMLKKEGVRQARLFTKEGLDGVSVDENYITLEGWYYIQFDQLKTKLALLHWVAHLLGKKWVTKEHLYWLVEVASTHHGYNPHDEI